MSVAGYKVSDIESYVLSGGRRGKPMPGVSASGMFSLPDLQYEDNDFQTTESNFLSRVTRGVTGLDSTAFADASPEQLNEIFNTLTSTKAMSKEEAFNLFSKAGNGFAKLETALIARGYEDGMGGSNLRQMLLSDVSNRIDTLEEVEKFNDLIRKDPKALADYILDKHRAGGISDDDIDKLLSGEALSEEAADAEVGADVPKIITTGLPPVEEAPQAADAATSSVVGGIMSRTSEDETKGIAEPEKPKVEVPAELESAIKEQLGTIDSEDTPQDQREEILNSLVEEYGLAAVREALDAVWNPEGTE